MRKTLALAALTTTALAVLATPAQAAAPRSTQLACFDDEGSAGTCSSNGGGSFTLSNAAGGYSGVYLQNKSVARKSFAKLTSLGFSYAGAISGGSPRLSIQIIGDDGRDGWLFIDAASCDENSDGSVTPLTDANCAVSGYYWNSDDTTEGFYYASYAAFLAGEAGAVIGKATPFVIADQPGTVTVSAIQLGNAK